MVPDAQLEDSMQQVLLCEDCCHVWETPYAGMQQVLLSGDCLHIWETPYGGLTDQQLYGHVKRLPLSAR